MGATEPPGEPASSGAPPHDSADPRPNRSGGAPVAAPGPPLPGDADDAAAGEALLAGRVEEYRQRWHRVQLAFVDEPRRAVEEADHLVDDVIASIVDTLAGQRARLEAGWQQGAEATTEELRLALRRYRAFLNRLLATG